MLHRQVVRGTPWIMALFSVVAALTAVADVPLQMSYQVMLTDNDGQPLSDQTVELVFSIYDESNQQIWTESHTDTTNSIGVVSLVLGKTTSLPAGEFDAPLWLEVSVEGQPLTPRRELVSGPYALHSYDSDRLGGSIADSYALRGSLAFPGTINDPDNPVDWTKLKGVPGGFADSIDDGEGGVGDGCSLDASDGDPQDVVYVDAEGLVGIGTTTPDVPLHIATGTDVSPDGGGYLQMGSSSGTNVAIDNNEIMARNGGAASDLYVNREGANVLIGNVGYGSRLGIGVTSPRATLHVVNNLSDPETPYNGLIFAYNENDTSPTADAAIGVRVNGPNAGDPYISYDIRGEAGWSIGVDNDDGNKLKLAARWDDLTVNTKMTVKTDGSVGIGTTEPAARLDVNGNMMVNDITSHHQSFDFYDASGGHMMLSQGKLGIGTSPATALDVRGDVTVRAEDDGHIVIELGEGLDYAEGFDIAGQTGIEPGAVLAIDPARPGKLTLSTRPYDTRVAGIVAGAGGVGSGVRLGGEGFSHDVALAGRVYCNVDATKCGIEPGDLLTTSSTPGYAMKAEDRTLAAGAIIGKAMEPLEKGTKGQILVLVSLQ